ncbi:hypothetical protein HanRHA438_Chr02g0092191 [Helianthus annuus]|nr:hypothetical protein HanRHA438_Chr02g0092191 [Helianthus annuus]
MISLELDPSGNKFGCGFDEFKGMVVFINRFRNNQVSTNRASTNRASSNRVSIIVYETLSEKIK